MGKFIAHLMDYSSFFYMSLRRRKEVKLSPYSRLVEYYQKEGDNFYDDIVDKSHSDIQKHLIHTTKNYEVYKIKFSSPLSSPYSENNIVQGKMYYVEDKAPSIIIIHGWRCEDYSFFDDAGKKLANIGFNCILFDLPYHIRRAPPGTFSGEYMISPDIIRTCEAVRQALWEISTLINYFTSKSARSVGLFGVSLGGMLTSLALSYEKRVKFAILINPASNPLKSFLKSKMQKFIMPNFKLKDIPLPYLRHTMRIIEIINPMSKKILVDKNDILLLASLYDNMMPHNFTHNLWLKLNKPPYFEYPHGHLSVLFFEKKLFLDIENFLKKYK